MDNQRNSGSMNLTLNGVTMAATGIVGQTVEALRASSEIPVDAQEAVENFVIDKINELLEQAANLLEFPIPDWLIDIWPTVVEILLKVF
jgi:hypothetical protein